MIKCTLLQYQSQLQSIDKELNSLDICHTVCVCVCVDTNLITLYTGFVVVPQIAKCAYCVYSRISRFLGSEKGVPGPPTTYMCVIFPTS